MRLVTYSIDSSGPAVGILDGDRVHATGVAEMLTLIRSGAPTEVTGQSWPIEEVRIGAPLPRPGKLLFCGVNYASHQRENPAAVLPTVPFFFSKLSTAVVGPGEDIRIPAPDSQVDYEVELAMVIGRRGRTMHRDTALEHVFGYTVVNDVSGRDVQFTDSQITLGKGFDTFCPMGPSIVTADEIPDPQALTVSCRVNGERRQSETTANMLFPAGVVLEHVSRYITLEPGDIVTTGTPAGVGYFRLPQAFLAPGDVVEVEVDAIGVLRNPVVAGW